jgi:hypothetical protein
MKDYQTTKGRLTKKKGNEHFLPELDDDFFGFNQYTQKTTTATKIGLILVGVLFGLLLLAPFM